MATATAVPVEVYLRTAYRPDCDFVDGEVVERNMGELPHGRLQGFFVKYFGVREESWGVEAIPELRVQVGPTRYRVPDVCVVPIPSDDTLIVQTPPVLCIEIFSSDDRMSRMQERVSDYKRMGVPAVWVVDPWRRVAYRGEAEGRLTPVEDELLVPDTAVRVAVEELWAELDRLAQRSAV